MNARRLLGTSERNYYHIMSRVIEQRFIFGTEEKQFFWSLMRRLEKFMGIRILTYCIMSNHFHILLEVTSNKDLDDKEILHRIDNFYQKEQALEIRKEYENCIEYEKKSGCDILIKDWRSQYLNRMGNLSNFGKELKERFSRWYNTRVDRRGPLWIERFKSVLIEDSESALSTMSAYIDLNPVRAGIVTDPKDYSYCGYAEALNGGTSARLGICALAQVIRRDEKEPEWKNAISVYRCHLYNSVNGKRIDPDYVKKVYKSGEKLSKQDLLSCRVRYFSDGLALGSKTFIDTIFTKHCRHFWKKRSEGARQMKQTDGSFFTLKDLRNEPIRAPG